MKYSLAVLRLVISQFSSPIELAVGRFFFKVLISRGEMAGGLLT